jgi:hypothetical protein
MKDYGVWITDKDGSNGRWMSDEGYNLDMWLVANKKRKKKLLAGKGFTANSATACAESR